MASPLIVRRRERNQRLVGSRFRTPADAVAWFGAVQAQDFAGAKWALAQRVAGATNASIDAAFDAGRILRTHVLRPTWHFVAPADLRWLQDLTAPRVHARNAHIYRQVAVDGRLVARSQRVIARALDGGRCLTREDVARALGDAAIPAAGLRLVSILMHAELDGLICSGPRRGKQFTYALLDERPPAARRRSFTRDEALAELARRYFTSHGPATAADAAWWSGLTIRDMVAGATDAGLDHETIDGRVHWFDAAEPVPRRVSPCVFLLPNYDEFLGSYRQPIADAAIPDLRAAMALARTTFPHHVVVHGAVAGAWRRDVDRRRVRVFVRPFRRFSAAEREGVATAARAFGMFLGLPIDLTIERVS